MGVVVIGGGGSGGGGGGGGQRATAYPTGEVVSLKGEIIATFSTFEYAQSYANFINFNEVEATDDRA